MPHMSIFLNKCLQKQFQNLLYFWKREALIGSIFHLNLFGNS